MREASPGKAVHPPELLHQHAPPKECYRQGTYEWHKVMVETAASPVGSYLVSVHHRKVDLTNDIRHPEAIGPLETIDVQPARDRLNVIY